MKQSNASNYSTLDRDRRVHIHSSCTYWKTQTLFSVLHRVRRNKPTAFLQFRRNTYKSTHLCSCVHLRSISLSCSKNFYARVCRKKNEQNLFFWEQFVIRNYFYVASADPLSLSQTTVEVLSQNARSVHFAHQRNVRDPLHFNFALVLGAFLCGLVNVPHILPGKPLISTDIPVILKDISFWVASQFSKRCATWVISNHGKRPVWRIRRERGAKTKNRAVRSWF